MTVGAGDNVVRLLPPLIVTDAEIDDAINRVERACAAFVSRSSAEREVPVLMSTDLPGHFLDISALPVSGPAGHPRRLRWR
ncbi:hypothetical protein [Streptomyces griseus]